MNLGLVRGHADQLRGELYTAFNEDHTQREIAGSFAIGTFVTMLPTLGLGLLLFAVIVYVSDGVSKLALFASVLVFNPVVKWGVYVASFAIGVSLLGPLEGVTTADVSMGAGREIVVRLLLGNLILTIVVTVISYVAVHRLAAAYGSTSIGASIDDALEEIAEDILEP